MVSDPVGALAASINGIEFFPADDVFAKSNVARLLNGNAAERQPAWLLPASRPLDENGPAGRPFESMGDDYADTCAYDHLVKAAEKHPGKTAIADRGMSLTFADVLAAVRNLAAMIEASAGKGEPIGTLAGNTAYYPISLLAAMAAGCPVIALNPGDPPERLQQVIRSARLAAVITTGAETAADDSEDGQIKRIVASPSLFRRDSSAPEYTCRARLVDAPAVVLYTSGSTGEPKGIVNSQRAILRRVQQHCNACHIGSDDVMMPLSGSGTIAGCRESLTALLTGAKLVIADVEQTGLRGIRRLIRQLGVTIIFAVPTLARTLMTVAQDDDFASLRVVRIGGEKVLWTDIDAIRKAVSVSCHIQISYSSTETTGAQWFVPRDYAPTGAAMPCGYMLPGVTYAILDDAGVAVPAGESGELFIRSKYVLLGHWENGRVAEQGTDAVFSDLRIFPTGDIARLDVQGRLEIVGRKGRQIKINGKRVEPAELEVVLRRIPGVNDAVATVTAANELIAFVVSAGAGEAALLPALRAEIRQSLPSSLHPARIHFIGEILRLPGGKVDSSGLRAIDLGKRGRIAAAEASDASGAGAADGVVKSIWMRILGVRQASGRWDEAGGDSLKLLQLVMDVENTLGIELGLDAFTVAMTFEDMQRAVFNAGETENAGPRPSGDDSTLFMLPGSVGHGPSLAAFCAAISSVERVAPVRYPDLGGMLDGQDSISAMTDAAIQQINQIQPKGAVRLLGYSLGGAVAFEAASRLQAVGREVKFLGILDTNVAELGQGRLGETVSRTIQRIRSHRVSIYRMACRALAKMVAKHRLERQFAGWLERPLGKRLKTTRFILKLELEEVLRMRAMGQWRRIAKPRLPVTATLFRCERPGLQSNLGWGSLASTVNVVPIAGGHLDMVIEPHVSHNLPLINAEILESAK